MDPTLGFQFSTSPVRAMDDLSARIDQTHDSERLIRALERAKETAVREEIFHVAKIIKGWLEVVRKVSLNFLH